MIHPGSFCQVSWGFRMILWLIIDTIMYVCKYIYIYILNYHSNYPYDYPESMTPFIKSWGVRIPIDVPWSFFSQLISKDVQLRKPSELGHVRQSETLEPDQLGSGWITIGGCCDDMGLSARIRWFTFETPPPLQKFSAWALIPHACMQHRHTHRQPWI